MTVLIVTRDLDPSADQLVAALSERGVEVFRMNTRWFPTQLRVTARLRRGRWSGTLATEHRTLDLEQISAVWYRAPEAFQMPAELTAAEAGHARVEAKYGLGGVLASLPARWCNHPSQAADASYKPVQLARAMDCGLHVPDTLIGNDAEPIRQFATGGALVSKLVGGMGIDEDGVRKNVFTHRVSAAELADLAGVEHTTHLFQRWVPKQVEARVIVIGEHITAAAITAASPGAYIDYRSDYPALSYALITPPAQVSAGVRELMGQLGLLYAALDFVITPDGEWVFLEINPSGQYGWIETATGVALTSQLADLLGGATR